MIIHILTIFPKMFEGVLNESILKRAQKNGFAQVFVHDLRKWTHDEHKTVDDKPYGGGAGMIMKIEPIYEAIQEIKSQSKNPDTFKIAVMSAKGQQFNHNLAKSLTEIKELLIICPRYEGIDQRVIDNLVDMEISVGPYVLTGGELPAMTIVDATIRLLPGVLGNEESLSEESFSDPENAQLEYPQYTRPEDFKGWKVPQILLSGNHEQIARWKANNKKSTK